MIRLSKRLLYLGFLVILAGISGCGGGGGETSSSIPSYPARVVRWVPPTTYTDSTPLNPATDLDSFEIYVKTTGPFTVGDSPLALVSAIDPGTGQIATSFNLANLSPFLSLGVQYQVSLRAVAWTGAKSDFSSPASFSF